jgi:hypothetical protein
MKHLKTFEELNIDMMNSHGIKDGKLEPNKEYLWIEKGTRHEKEYNMPPIKVKYLSFYNDEWGNFEFCENKNGHKAGEKQKIEIHSIYPLNLQVDGFNNPTNYKH